MIAKALIKDYSTLFIHSVISLYKDSTKSTNISALALCNTVTSPSDTYAAVAYSSKVSDLLRKSLQLQSSFIPSLLDIFTKSNLALNTPSMSTCLLYI